MREKLILAALALVVILTLAPTAAASDGHWFVSPSSDRMAAADVATGTIDLEPVKAKVPIRFAKQSSAAAADARVFNPTPTYQTSESDLMRQLQELRTMYDEATAAAAIAATDNSRNSQQNLGCGGGSGGCGGGGRRGLFGRR